jgi:heme exporter protein C
VRRLLGGVTLVGLLAGLVMGFGIAPRETTQGNVQRIMYLHVPSVWVAYLAFGVVLVASIVYLVRRAESADQLAHASAEVGVLFTGLTIATGSIWGKPTWGTWWTWDARLTSVSILFVMYLGYLLLRGMIDDRERGARFAAVLGIVAAFNIPLMHFSVY